MTSTPSGPSSASTETSQPAILVLNSGSSSLKAGLFTHAPGVGFAQEEAIITASATGLGHAGGKLTVTHTNGTVLAEEDHSIASSQEALSAIAAALKPHAPPPQAIGHRIVHGGPSLRAPVRVTKDVVAQLRRSVHFAPLHLPGSLGLIEAASRLYPDTPQFACFDTAFHATMPAESTRLPIPELYAAQGVQRYGFHGLSYESLIAQLRFSGEPLPERIVCAHLGGGSSLCAVLRGRSIDTTMGLTPTGGVPMATRTGDLDPGVLLFMARTQRLSLDALESLVNHDAGLKAICGESDMQTIEAMRIDGRDRPKQANAELGFSIYTTAVAQSIAALTVSLGGLDLLVFAGGIGEHSSTVRAAILSRLAIFGVWCDQDANARGAARIDAAKSKVPLRIVPAEEDLIIAQHTRRLLALK